MLIAPKPKPQANLKPNPLSDFKWEVKDRKVTITKFVGKGTQAVIPRSIEGKSVTAIGKDAFINCSRLTSITIPDSVTSIGQSAFWYCTSLTSITIPNSVTSIGAAAFGHCTSLTNITIPDGVTSIGSWAIRECTSLTSITIPNSVTSIGGYAFYNCYNLLSITIPDSVTSVEKNAFNRCSRLTAVTFLGDAPKAGDEVFSNATPTIYRQLGTKGWGDTWGGRPVKLISEKPKVRLKLNTIKLEDILMSYTWRYTAGPYKQTVHFKENGTAVNVQKKNYKWKWRVLDNRRLTIIFDDGNSCSFDFGNLSSLTVIGRTQKHNSKRTLSAITE
ncbi:leucine-rich repeat domain-containing protein [Verrucomicrobia bacterium]|nr:leucine-rich repeat domain-containing protein [Verrucomicrobiota bacterium]